MKIGIPKEIKPNENRISLVPAGAAALVSAGHTVIVETGAGLGSDFTDAQYLAAGAQIAKDADAVWAASDLIVKVKEPIAPEWKRNKPGHIIFTYFHFAANESVARALIASGAVCIAYETIELPSGELPLLTPMSEVAGRMAVQEGAKYLENLYGGRGILLSGVPGVPPAKVVILGGGVVGVNAAKIAAGMGAHVVILDVSLEKLRYLSDVMPANVQLIFSNRHNLLDQITGADLVIGAVLVHGAVAPKLIRREDLVRLHSGAVIVDVSIDQGGAAETSHATTHSNPTYIEEGVIHYCVSNMPGAVPQTSTQALTSATLPFVEAIANFGVAGALSADSALAESLSTYQGKLVRGPVAETFGMSAGANPFLA